MCCTSVIIKMLGNNVEFPLIKNKISSFLRKKLKFQIIKENLKILDYEQKSENFYK